MFVCSHWNRNRLVAGLLLMLIDSLVCLYVCMCALIDWLFGFHLANGEWTSNEVFCIWVYVFLVLCMSFIAWLRALKYGAEFVCYMHACMHTYIHTYNHHHHHHHRQSLGTGTKWPLAELVGCIARAAQSNAVQYAYAVHHGLWPTLWSTLLLSLFARFLDYVLYRHRSTMNASGASGNAKQLCCRQHPNRWFALTLFILSLSLSLYVLSLFATYNWQFDF